jgi:hypothetical protein
MCTVLWSCLVSYSNNEPIIINPVIIIPISLGMGWGIFQMIFVKGEKTKEEARINIREIAIATIQSSVIMFLTMFIMFMLGY